jgi:hypothetical protein
MRKFRELAELDSLDTKKHKHCIAVYTRFCRIYKRLETTLETSFNKKKRKIVREELMVDFLEIMQPHKNDPRFLATYKSTAIKRINKYFLCLTNQIYQLIIIKQKEQ